MKFRHDTVAIGLHWLVAILLIPMLLFGEELMGDDGGTFLPSIHISLGVSILVLSLLRLAWRMINPPPDLPATMAEWEKTAASATHILFYVLMIGLPLTGWLAFDNFLPRHPGMAGVTIFGLTQVPYAPDPGRLASNIHNLASKIGLALLGLHVLAAFKHQFYNRDGLLRRMLPF